MCRIVITRRNQNVIIFLYMLHHSSTSFHACHQIYSNLIELWSWAWEFEFDLRHGVRFLFYFCWLGWNWNFFEMEILNEDFAESGRNFSKNWKSDRNLVVDLVESLAKFGRNLTETSRNLIKSGRNLVKS